MKNKISFLTFSTLVVLTCSSCFISLRGGRAGRPHHGDRDYVEPMKNGMDHASVMPLRLDQSSQIQVGNLKGCRAD